MVDVVVFVVSLPSDISDGRNLSSRISGLLHDPSFLSLSFDLFFFSQCLPTFFTIDTRILLFIRVYINEI
jgi:hypothetical protein